MFPGSGRLVKAKDVSAFFRPGAEDIPIDFTITSKAFKIKANRRHGTVV